MYDYDVHTGEVFDARTGTTHLVASNRATALQLCALLSGVVSYRALLLERARVCLQRCSTHKHLPSVVELNNRKAQRLLARALHY